MSRDSRKPIGQGQSPGRYTVATSAASQRGSTLVQVLLAVALLGFLSLSISTWTNSTVERGKSLKIPLAAAVAKRRIMESIVDNRSWDLTVGLDSNEIIIGCMNNELRGSQCAPYQGNPSVQQKPPYLDVWLGKVIDAGDVEGVYNTSDSAQGIDFDGRTCVSYPSNSTANPTTDCLMRYEILYRGLVDGVYPRITGTLKLHPSLSGKVILNPEPYSFEVIRGVIADHYDKAHLGQKVETSCNSILTPDGVRAVYDQANKECSFKLEASDRSCGSHQYVSGLYSNECSSVPAVSTACPSGQGARGVGANGSFVCGVVP